jgi:hypothetical protein
MSKEVIKISIKLIGTIVAAVAVFFFYFLIMTWALSVETDYEQGILSLLTYSNIWKIFLFLGLTYLAGASFYRLFSMFKVLEIEREKHIKKSEQIKKEKVW